MKLYPVPQDIPKTTQEVEIDALYRVIIHNDDITPMDFVIVVLERFFFIFGSDAVEIMYAAHFTGAAYVQSLSRMEAQNRIAKAHFAASLEGYPLHFSMEQE